MSDVVIQIADISLDAVWEEDAAPLTCAAMRDLLPLEGHLVHVRWSGFAVWVPLGDESLPVPPENATSYPLPGQIVLFPGGISEPEILMPYGSTHFNSQAGQLAGNHLLTIVAGAEYLPEIGRRVLWEGAQPISFVATSAATNRKTQVITHASAAAERLRRQRESPAASERPAAMDRPAPLRRKSG